MTATVTAPWDEATVHALNACQHGGGFHGFTCAEHSNTLLVANTDGWHCPERGCGYWQDWALLAMVDVGREVIAGTWKTSVEAWLEDQR